jgi:hypothetical protein
MCVGCAYNTALCYLALGWLFCGAFFGVCREQLFGFCPRVSALWAAAKDNVLQEGLGKT